MHKFAIVPLNNTADYWDGWWSPIASHAPSGSLLLQSKRTGEDAKVDAIVLQGRLFSGLHGCAVFDDVDTARAHMSVR